MGEISKLYSTALSDIFTCLLLLIAIDFCILYILLTSQADNAILLRGGKREECRRKGGEGKRTEKWLEHVLTGKWTEEEHDVPHLATLLYFHTKDDSKENTS